MLKIIGIILLIFVFITIALLIWLSKKPTVIDDYINKVQTGDIIEAKYLAMASYDVSYLEQVGMKKFKKYEISYPFDIADGIVKYFVVIYSNGTGILHENLYIYCF